MPGYIHTCERCGAHMQVHERYLGRTLRCTSCRTEFLAELPADAVVDEPAPPELPADSTRPATRRRWVWLALAVVPLAVLLWWLGQEQPAGVGGDLFRPQRAAGEMGVLEREGTAPIIVALDRDTVEELVKSEGSAAARVLASGHAIEVAAGTQVRVLERVDRGRQLRVRILAGPWEGRIVWVPASWVR